MSGAEALWAQETMGGMSGMNDPLLAGGARLDSEVGYGLPIGKRFVGTPRAGILGLLLALLGSRRGRNDRRQLDASRGR